ANTFQFFSRNPRGTRARPLDAAAIEDMGRLHCLLEENEFGPLVIHAPYILNACSRDAGVRELAARVIAEDLARLEYLPGNYYNFHPGSHGGQGAEAAAEQIADMLNRVLHPEQKTMVLLETMSGHGTEMGGRFEELREIIDRVELTNLLGVCLDTCHVFAAGYDLPGRLDMVLEGFDAIIGLDRLKAVHLNDSVHPLGSGKDRHANIGEGEMGLDCMVEIINHPSLSELPFNLETHHELPGYKAEIAMLRKLYRG
ncbi:MAG: deoxyribonuclease IV, partial [Desulfovibrionaceae bacterium]|nr:deoxyribonuclease IV [Desulfovibrionaceae bacterium]